MLTSITTYCIYNLIILLNPNIDMLIKLLARLTQLKTTYKYVISML